MTTCKNCGNIFEGNYCNQCGQSSKTKKINAEFLWEDIEHGILHYDKGIGYSLKKLFEKPGVVIREYMEGKRVNHFRPISMVIILATVYALVYHLLNLNHRSNLDDSSAHVLDLIFAHYYYFIVATIPIFALSTFLLFKKTGYNFYEFIIFEAFKCSQRLSIHLIFLPLLYLAKEKSWYDLITNLLFLVDFVLILWTNRQFFGKMKLSELFFRSLFSYLIYYTIVSVVIGILLFIFTDIGVN